MTPPVRGSFELEIATEQQADSIVEDLNEQERKKLFDALNKKMGTNEPQKESKEKSEKLPELADKNFRVEDTKNRKKKTSPNGVKVKENPEGDIREYVEGDYKGEQLFTDTSARREANKTGKKLPASWTIYRDIINKKYEGNYQEFLKGEKMIFAGWRDPDNEMFTPTNRVFGLRCADASCFDGHRHARNDNRWNRAYGVSVRCLKD